MNFHRIFPVLVAVLAMVLRADAQLKFDAETVSAHGSPSEGKVHTHFTFTNAGKYAVKIKHTSTTCGCTAATVEKKIYQPGEKGEIAVSFSTLNRHGLYEQPITVETDDKSIPETALTLRVMVREPITVKPTLLSWRANEPLKPKSITVSVSEDFPVDKIEVVSSDPNVEARVETVKEGVAFRIVVTPKNAKAKARLTITPDYPPKDPKSTIAFVRAG